MPAHPVPPWIHRCELCLLALNLIAQNSAMQDSKAYVSPRYIFRVSYFNGGNVLRIPALSTHATFGLVNTIMIVHPGKQQDCS